MLSPAVRLFASELTVDDFFRDGIYKRTTLSPDGSLVAYATGNRIYVGSTTIGFHALHDYGSASYIGDITWVGDDALVAEIAVGRGDTTWVVLRFKIDENTRTLTADRQSHDMEGYIHDPLVNDPTRMLFAEVQRTDDTVTADIYDFELFGDTNSQLRRRNRVRTGSRDFFFYLQDADRNYVAGVERRETEFVIWYAPPGSDDWTERRSIDRQKTFVPYAVTADQKLLALTNSFTDKTAAVAIDLSGAAVDEVIYEHDRYDLARLILAPGDNRIAAVGFLEHGSPHLVYLDPVAKVSFEALADQFGEQSLLIIDSTSDSRVKLVVVSSPENPGTLYKCAGEIATCEKIGSVAPWLDDVDLGASLNLDVRSSDGLEVEAYLTLPPTVENKFPLVVVPHGGPIGVQDLRVFSSEVQWLAHNGYAVLQVNYRGSSGYGQAFQSAGLREWGRGIEDDIESSVLRVLAEFPQVDETRIGLFGSSYGGYSALMGVIRNPELFKCAASFAGVTDLPLVFARGIVKRNEDLRDILIRIVGDPEKDYAEMRENSPVYRFREINRPILLAHGADDYTVDVEHTWRLYKLLELRNMAPKLIIMANVGHGFEYLGEIREFYVPLVEFLDSNLKD
jgi:dipeptidyl aminopeptidase/acylaminoacyl peptidase